MLYQTRLLVTCFILCFADILFAQQAPTPSPYPSLNEQAIFLDAEDYFMNKADFELSEQLYRQLYEQISTKEVQERAYVGLRLALSLYNRQKTEQSLLLLNKIEKTLSIEKEENQLLLADLYTYRAKAYARQRLVDKALSWNEKAMELKEKNYPALHPKFGESYAVLTYVHNYFTKEYELAGKYLDLEEKVIIKHKDRYSKYDQVALHYKLASYCSKQGEYLKATTHGKKAIQLIEPFKDLHPNYLSRCYTTMGNVYLRMENPKLAVKYLEEGLKNKVTTKKDSTSRALAYTNIGYAYSLDGEAKKATKYIKRGLSFYPDRDTMYRAYSLTKLAEHYLDYPNLEPQKDILDSVFYCIKKSIQLYKSKYGEPKSSLTVPYSELASYHHKSGNLDSALYYSHVALLHSAPSFNDTSLFSQPSVTDCVNGYLIESILINKSLSSYNIAKQNNNKEALLHTLSINNLLDSLYTIKKKYSIDEYSILSHPNIQKSYGHLLETLHYAYEKTPNTKHIQQIFNYMERVKGNILLRNLSNIKQTKLFGVPDSIIRKSKEITEAINEYLSAHPESIINNHSELVPSNNELILLLQQKDNLEKKLKKEYPQYHQVRFQNLSLNLKTVKDKLGQHNLLEFYWTKNAIFALFISNKDPQIHRIPIDAKLSYAIDYHIQFLKENSKEGFVPFHKNAYELYSKLLAPIFKGNIPSKLIIVADGPLAAVPFETLLTAKSDLTSVNYRDLPYLLHKTAISYAYSTNTLFQAYDKSNLLKKPTLLAFSFTDKTKSSIGNSLLLQNGLAPLVNAVEEVKNLEELIPSNCFKAFYGPEATKDNFFSNYDRFDIIHLALHAQSDYRNLFNNKILFHPEETDSAPENYTCFAHELYNLNPPPRLVTLSACNTGAGTNYVGEGTYSSARGFIYAGTPSVIMSLWPLSDQAGKLINNSFYAGLLKGEPLDEALQEAKKSFIESADEWTAHPSRWAALNIIGSSKPVILSKSNYLNIFCGLALIGCLLALLLYYKNNKSITSN